MRQSGTMLGPGMTWVAWIVLAVNTTLLAKSFEVPAAETGQANAAGWYCGWRGPCGATCVPPPGPCVVGAYLGGACSDGGNHGTDGVSAAAGTTYGWCLPDFNYWSTATCTNGAPCGTNDKASCGVLLPNGNCSGPLCSPTGSSISGC